MSRKIKHIRALSQRTDVKRAGGRGWSGKFPDTIYLWVVANCPRLYLQEVLEEGQVRCVRRDLVIGAEGLQDGLWRGFGRNDSYVSAQSSVAQVPSRDGLNQHLRNAC